MRFYLLIFAIATGAGGYLYGTYVTNIKWKADTETAINEAVAAAMTKERALQNEVNKITQRQANELRNIIKRRDADIDSLRNRPSRRDVSRDTGADCSGASGSELAREYAEFSIRYSAKAAEQDAALAACYDYVDSLRH